MTNWAHHTWNSNMCKRNGFILGLLAATFFLTMSSSVSYARPKSLGATFSFTGFALSYEHELERYNSFIEASLKAETAELFLYRADLPGVSGTVTWNIKVKEWLSAEGNRLTFFAGPGIIAGYGYDYKMPQGVFFGLKGRIGIECSFYRNGVNFAEQCGNKVVILELKLKAFLCLALFKECTDIVNILGNKI